MKKSLTLRQQDELQEKIDKHIEGMTLTNAGWWRIKWRGKFIVVRRGTHQWETQAKAESAFKAYVRNDWQLLAQYLTVRDGKYDWTSWQNNKTEVAKELVKFLFDTNQIEFTQV